MFVSPSSLLCLCSCSKLFINDCKSYITPGLAGSNLTTTLSQFARLRELGGLLMSQGTEEQSTSSDEKASSSRTTRDFDQVSTWDINKS